MTEVEALQRALATLHQSVYGYGLAGAHLRTHIARDLALRHLDEERERRDRLAALVQRAGATPAPAAPAYQPPDAVTGREAALHLLVRLETSASQAALNLVASTTANEPARREAVLWLIDAAATAQTWGALAAQTSTTETGPLTGPAFPGQPAASQPSTTPTSSAS